jgi:hypothetical protein
MFRLLWSHHQAKGLRNNFIPGVTSDLSELVRDPLWLYIGGFYIKNQILKVLKVARGAR